MTKIEPHPTFSTIRADEVAECWDGVGRDLYAVLWDIAMRQEPIANIEDSGPFDHVGHENLASHWDQLSEAHQRQLNVLAVAQEMEEF